MKLTSILMLSFLSTAALATTDYSCISEQGEILITDHGQEGALVEFTSHKVIELDYFRSAYSDLVGYENMRGIKSNGIKDGVAIKLIPGQIEKGGFFGGLKYSNTEKHLIANSTGSRDFSSFKVKLDLNKKKLKAKIVYSVGLWPTNYGKINDELNCTIVE
jgi:hypothetical protein